MDIQAYEKALQTAQKVSFAYEDQFGDKNKRKLFGAIFDRFLLPVDPAGAMEPHDAIIVLWKNNPYEYDQMVRELQKSALI